MRGVILICGLLAGCAVENIPIANEVVAFSNQANVNKLRVGMSRAEMISIMGEPSKREAYAGTDFYMYRTEYAGSWAKRFTPVAVVNDRVSGWGQNYYEEAIRVNATVSVR